MKLLFWWIHQNDMPSLDFGDSIYNSRTLSLRRAKHNAAVLSCEKYKRDCRLSSMDMQRIENEVSHYLMCKLAPIPMIVYYKDALTGLTRSARSNAQFRMAEYSSPMGWDMVYIPKNSYVHNEFGYLVEEYPSLVKEWGESVSYESNGKSKITGIFKDRFPEVRGLCRSARIPCEDEPL